MCFGVGISVGDICNGSAGTRMMIMGTLTWALDWACKRAWVGLWNVMRVLGKS